MQNPQVTGWPIVMVEFSKLPSDEDVRCWLSSMSAMLDKQQPFAVILLTQNKGMSREARREQGIWFKQNKQRLADFCVGVARVVQPDQDPEQLAGIAMQRAMPFPLTACYTVAEADTLAKCWLSSTP